MTQIQVKYLYDGAPSESAMKALGQVRKVYGIRLVEVDESAKTVLVEYDATRLTEAIVHQLLCRSGIDVIEQVSLIPPMPEPEAVAPAAN